jgi:hypothetical protein
MRVLLFIILLFCTKKKCEAQFPKTSVYVFDLERSGKELNILAPKLVSKKTGYFVSSMDTHNVEVMKVDMTKKKLKAKRITRTQEPEYSPKQMLDDQFFSCVRVEKDDSTQHLTTYNNKGKSVSIVMPHLTKIGYYEWVNANEFISFDLPEPFYLVLHNMLNNRADTLATHIGRTFYYQANKSRLVYVDKSDTAVWTINMITQDDIRKIKKGEKVKPSIISETLRKEEDYVIMNDGSLLMGQQGVLYIKKNPFKNPKATWEKLCDIKKFGIAKFYRIALSRDNTKLALVAYNGDKP